MNPIVRVVLAQLTLPLLLAAGTSRPAMAQPRAGVTALWDTNCAKCHGDRGQGGGAGTQSLLTREKFGQDLDRPFFDAIKKGVEGSGMAAFGETLRDDQVWGLVVHIRELQANALRKQFGRPTPKDGVYTSAHHSYAMETVVGSGLVTPWAVDWLPDGSMLVTERGGRLRVWKDGALSEPVEGLPASREVGQGGLMDVAVHPEAATNGWVYLAYTKAGSESVRGPTMTTIVRGRLVPPEGAGKAWTFAEQRTIFEARPESFIASGLHFGSRVVFGPAMKEAGGKRHVFFSIGERGQGPHAQVLTRPNGKVHRVWDDGTIPDDNPLVARAKDDEKIYASIWSYGHRNPQGLVFDLAGDLWDTEHGPRGGDELNRIERGKNYGWPLVAFSINYNDAPLTTPWPETSDEASKAGLNAGDIAMPADRWLPSIGACGLTVAVGGAKGEAFPAWRGDLFAGGLSGQNVDRFRVRDGKVVEREEILQGLARVRDVVCGPEGAIYVVFNDPDKVVRLVPASATPAKGQ